MVCTELQAAKVIAFFICDSWPSNTEHHWGKTLVWDGFSFRKSFNGSHKSPLYISHWNVSCRAHYDKNLL